MRKHPNIVISGNPGVGKTTLAKKLAQAQTHMRYLDFGQEAVERGCHDGWDEDLKCHIIDYDKLAKQMRDNELHQGGCIIDWIHADFWPFDGLINLVITVTCDNTVLYDRYEARGYDQQKINENLDSEIMEEIVEENRAWFEQEVDDMPNITTLVKLKSETNEDMQKNLITLEAWIAKWYARRTTNGHDQSEVGVSADHSSPLDPFIRRVSIDEPQR